MPRLQLQLVLVHGMAIGTGQADMERAVRRCQRPLIEALERHSNVPCALHLTGHVLEWLDAHEEGLVDRLFALCSAGSVEMIGGGFYAPILSLLPWRDAIGQLDMMAGYLDRHTGRRPEGAWLERRVWEPRLAEVLADGGARYTFLEEHQLLAAGARTPLRGPLVTEHIGRPLALLPIDAELSALATGGQLGELMRAVRSRAAVARPGDCYTVVVALQEDWQAQGDPGGIAGLFAALEELTDVLDVVLPRAVLGRRDPPPPRIYVPSSAGSLAGPGLWQRWLDRHGTADRLHKRMVDVSRRFAALERVVRNQGWRAMSQLSRPRRWLYRGQTAEAYAAGEGGGLMRPEIRAAAWRNLIDAERVADGLVRGDAAFLEVALRDLYADLGTAVLLRNQQLRAVLRPDHGGVIAELEHVATGTALTDVLAPDALTEDDPPGGPATSEARGPDPACLHTRFVAADAPPAAWMHGGAELSDLTRARYRLISVDSDGRGADERARVALSCEGTLKVAGDTVGVSLVQHVQLGARDDTLIIRLELRFDRPLPASLHFATTYYLNLQVDAAGSCGVEIDGLPRPDPRLEGRGSDDGVHRVTFFNRALGVRVSLASDLPVIAERAPVLTSGGDLHLTRLQGNALAMRLPLPAGSRGVDWGLSLSVAGHRPAHLASSGTASAE